MDFTSGNDETTFMFLFAKQILTFLSLNCINELFQTLKNGPFPIILHPAQNDHLSPHIHCLFGVKRPHQKIQLFGRALKKLLGSQITDQEGLNELLKKTVVALPGNESILKKFWSGLLGHCQMENNFAQLKTGMNSACINLLNFWKKNKTMQAVSDCLSIFNVKDIKRLLLCSGTVNNDYFAQEDYEKIDDSDKTEAVR